MTHFVVIVPYALPPLQKRLTKFFVSKGAGYWHWCNECWLLAFNDESLDAGQLRDQITEEIPKAYFLVLRVDLPSYGANWATMGIPPGQDWAAWLQTQWEYKFSLKGLLP